jgi:alkylated DNA repair dioxygenase AlkB
MTSPRPYKDFEPVTLPDGHLLWLGSLPPTVLSDDPEESRRQLDALWGLRTERPILTIHGRPTQIPRWQQAYEEDYDFSHQTSRAVPAPPQLMLFLEWGQQVVDSRLNGLLVNWYAARDEEIGDGKVTRDGDYIGPHRDDWRQLIPGAPIVTISLGGARTFRLRTYRGEGTHDFRVRNGTVIILPFETNLAYTHEVPKPRRVEQGRRISITLRAFSAVTT